MRVPRDKKKLICLASAMVLVACFFLPIIGRDVESNEGIVPYEWLLHSIKPLFGLHINFALFGAAYLFGSLVVVICICDLLGRGQFVRRIAALFLFALLVFGIGMTYYGIIYSIRVCPPGPMSSEDEVFCHIVWPLIGITAVWSLNALRRKYPFDTKLAMWQLAGSVVASVWFLHWTIMVRLGFCNYFEKVCYGLWLSLFSSLVLLVCFATECREKLNCSWKWLLPSLIGFSKKREETSPLRVPAGLTHGSSATEIISSERIA